jgi:eukaryotic-like serine/threonine-protein kinase
MIDHTLGHYRVVEQIGAGGMGVVYRARDQRLDRDVALKILPPHSLQNEISRKRFRKEALALAQLTHPNIAHIYDFDVDQETDFLVMEIVPGKNLAEIIANGSLPEKEVIALGDQIASALQEAHEHGIVHRDLKPGNVMVTPKGQVKVLDFGLAGLLATADRDATATATEYFGAAGTLPYMAPEQLRGEPADQRADIYALGCLLYEMSVGTQPFDDQSAALLAQKILTQPPSMPHSLRGQRSVELDRIILKCLEKDPENRFQSMKELRVDLRRLAQPTTGSVGAAPTRTRKRGLRIAIFAAVIFAAVFAAVFVLDLGKTRERWFADSSSARINSIAVLPLENLSHDTEQDYFADGMTEALIANLTKIGALHVSSRSSILRYRGTKLSLPEIANELNVDAVVEGTIQRSGDQVRVSVELVRAKSNQNLWADTYERGLQNVLSLQSEVAAAIASQIRVQITPTEKVSLASSRPVNPKAYEDYLKGRYYWNKRSDSGFRQAVEYFQESIQEDPAFAPSYSGLADSYMAQAYYETILPKDDLARSMAAASKAVELDPSSSEGVASLGLATYSMNWDMAGAEKLFQRAMQLDPHNGNAPHWYGEVLSIMGRNDEAIASEAKAIQLDPVSLVYNTWVGRRYYFARRYAEAEGPEKHALEMDPNFTPALLQLGFIAVQLKKYDEAIAAFQKAVEVSGGKKLYVAGLAYANAAAGRKADALKILRELEMESGKEYVPAVMIAYAYGAIGDKDKAFQWLNRAFDDRSNWMVYLNIDPALDPLRTDPRLAQLIQRVGLPH